MSINNINKIVVEFLTNNNQQELVGSWKSKENQKRVKSVLSNKESLTVKEKKENLPKRGKSAYLFFCKEVRGVIQKEFTDMKATDVTRELGVRWNVLKLTPAREKYDVLALEDKQRYESEKESYSPSSQSVSSSRKQVGPKRSKSSYLCYCDEERLNIKQEHPEMQAKDVIRELGRRWSLLKTDPSKLEKYVQLSLLDKQRCFEESGYSCSFGKSTDTPSLVTSEVQNSLSPVVDESQETPVLKSVIKKSAPRKVRSNGYKAFCSAHREETKKLHPELTKTQLTENLKLRWKELPESEQEKYE